MASHRKIHVSFLMYILCIDYRQSQLRCLLASEVVHLMCLVPLFFESLEGHPGLMRMVVTATKNPNVADVIGGIAWKVQAKGVSTKQSRVAICTMYTL